MLCPENEAFISFQPGSVNKRSGGGKHQLGRIVIHDRLKVEADILPHYFNHNSFASLRRQLNYFAFERLGKGRQQGATYFHENVVELEDILRLKRRPHVSGTGARTSKKARMVTPKQSKSVSKGTSKHASPTNMLVTTTKPKVVSPRLSPVNLSTTPPTVEPKIALDLTLPSTSYASDAQQYSLASWHATRATLTMKTALPPPLARSPARRVSATEEELEDDLMEGCKALLCFSKGHHSSMMMHSFG